MKRLLFILALFLTVSLSGQLMMPAATTSAAWDGSFCAEYQAIYDVMTTPPGRDGVDTARLQNDMVKALVKGGYWTGRMDLFYVFANKAKVDAWRNWAQVGSFNATDVSVTTWTQYEGFTGDASVDAINSNWVPSSDALYYSQNSATIGVYIRSEVNAAQVVAGAYNSVDGHYIRIYPRTSGLFNARINNTSGIGVANATSLGLALSTRRASDDIEQYMNGSSLGASSDYASTGLPTISLWFLGMNTGTAYPSLPYSGQIAIAFVMNGCSDEDVAAINTIIEIYMDGIGKGVQE